MKIFKIILACFFIVTTSFKSAQIGVYICGPKGAKKYHFSSNCRGLSQCDHKIYKVHINQARQFGLTLCGWEN